ncbi:MAG: hypothetical protein IJ638_00955 [Alphaproteobacteria bacterium]|nr:hypothetical protein [Alphaproteobacteria bacterium]
MKKDLLGMNDLLCDKDLKKELEIMPVYFVKTFNTDSGKKVLEYLVSITLNRYLSPVSSDSELRFLEGQRYLVSFIKNMIKKGMK